MIDVIIDLINNVVGGIHEEEIILGLAQRVYRQNSDETVDFMPGIVNHEGEAIYAGVDDIRSLMLYHKSNAASFSFGARTGYGDGRISEDSFDLSVITVWDTRKINLEAIDMAILIRARMPQFIKDVPNVSQTRVLPLGAILNTKQVFESEYSLTKNYMLPLYIRFIQLNYKIELKYDQQCMEKCINCSK